MSNAPKIKNIQEFQSKLQIFKEHYKNSPSSIVIVMDFDFTITERYNYSEPNLPQKYTCYTIYEKKFNNKHEDLTEKAEKLKAKYMKYEHDSSVNLEFRNQMMIEWYHSTLDNITGMRFNKDETRCAIVDNPAIFTLRKSFSTYVTLALQMDIPLVIISAGLSEVIVEVFRTQFPFIDNLIEQRKIIIISNDFIYDENNICAGYVKPIIYTFNKANFLKKKISEILNINDIKKIFVFGDNVADYDSINEFNFDKKDIIGFGFCNLKPLEIANKECEDKNNKYIKEFMDVYDCVLMGNEGYDKIIEYLNFIKN